ncbi:hypothetical protein [Chryseobacterium indoltheticum]|uniref:hypothetical protein n=1 Tax=Chryseobacterium indoltheticum TaxID=254 RepID=UPI0013DE3948|nr:hypothetical protein [Chryseobacterium indoltheticum]
MKAKIIKCGNPQYWYADKIGQVFTIYDRIQGDYRLRVGLAAKCVADEDIEIIQE